MNEVTNLPATQLISSADRTVVARMRGADLKSTKKSLAACKRSSTGHCCCCCHCCCPLKSRVCSAVKLARRADARPKRVVSENGQCNK